MRLSSAVPQGSRHWWARSSAGAAVGCSVGLVSPPQSATSTKEASSPTNEPR
eukprot:CAMPEP_0119470470 /NCGR_PEP_ID=MMETSP1344-20130328/3361_1 /TAXON_ID=236787 /ORGANISM="Florenciella parvula, Strain CCMP2471" /LENGTH=51 /DNA_ID=CAMNT_0007503153 /DNA_START=196 /DNA_END=347 /DNA_ORIENTATION=-